MIVIALVYQLLPVTFEFEFDNSKYIWNGNIINESYSGIYHKTDMTYQGYITDNNDDYKIERAYIDFDAEETKVYAENVRDRDVIFNDYPFYGDVRFIPCEESLLPRHVGIDTLQQDSTGDNAIYDLQGRRCNPDNLQPGIYIRNGKKLIVH